MIATLVAQLGELGKPGGFYKLLEAHDITTLDLCLYGMTLMLVLWICAIARTSIRGACRRRAI